MNAFCTRFFDASIRIHLNYAFFFELTSKFDPGYHESDSSMHTSQTLMWKLVVEVILMLTLTNKMTFQKTLTKKDSPKILILGAGMAGISAAKRLDELGHTNFQIIEGSNRVGGRIKEVKIGNFTSELGAQWIHSLGSNPIYKLATDFGLLTLKQDYDDFIVYNSIGHDVTNLAGRVQKKFEKTETVLDKILSKILMYNKPDTSVKAGLIMAGWHPKTPLENFIEFFNVGVSDALPAEYISLKFSNQNTYLTHGNEEDILVKDSRGYSHLVRSLLNTFLKEREDRLILNKVVTEISYTNNSVMVRTHDNHTFTADYAIVTFSLGVLQQRIVKFTPPLPFWKRESISQLKMAVFYHVHLQFPEVFWDNRVYFLYSGTRKGYFSIWQNIEKVHPGSKALYATIIDEEAKRLDYLADDQIKAEALAVMNKMYPNKTIPNPTNFFMEKWHSNPLFKGSYTAWPTGFSNDTFKGLCAPVGRLYFAGEAYEFKHIGYVHGAYYSGRRKAEDIVTCDNNIQKCEKYVPLYLTKGCKYKIADNYDMNAKIDDGSCLFSSALTLSGTNQINYIVPFVSYILKIAVIITVGIPLTLIPKIGSSHYGSVNQKHGLELVDKEKSYTIKRTIIYYGELKQKKKDSRRQIKRQSVEEKASF
ncbi:hypothetical protein KUTeg_013733 [Tegillarca granosa]|uniref:Amine oxidase n=1 Tax=Tegillarca granosa TaxID=220873 RepID=A0ABQ9EUJ8_TEGGR|nr:hypothetical protein KUTeg_013733 [Tegillarca granosa]